MAPPHARVVACNLQLFTGTSAETATKQNVGLNTVLATVIAVDCIGTTLLAGFGRVHLAISLDVLVGVGYGNLGVFTLGSMRLTAC